jgi:Cys-tRNA(Pro) deacylase
MTEFLSSEDLRHFIESNHIDATILPMNGHTATVGDAARELGVETDQIIKSLVFVAGDSPLLVINNGLSRVDRKKLAVLMGVGQKKVKFATAAQAQKMTGFVVGSMPPFGHRERLRTLVDPAVMALEAIYGGGGDIDAMMRLTPRELIKVTGAEVQAISES